MVNNALKEEYLELLRSTGREGIENLIEYLETKTDFFTAPASTKFHNNIECGLLAHTLNVYNNFTDLLGMKGVEMDESSVIICSLLHDLCKCNYYTIEKRNKKVDGKWVEVETWTSAKDISIPLPHASRSIRIIRNFIKLKFIEELTIFYHMGPFGGEDWEYRDLLKKVNEQYPQTVLFYAADLLSSYCDEKTYEN